MQLSSSKTYRGEAETQGAQASHIRAHKQQAAHKPGMFLGPSMGESVAMGNGEGRKEQEGRGREREMEIGIERERETERESEGQRETERE